MRESMTIRMNPGVLDAAKKRARTENRTLTNYIETVLRRELRLTAEDASLEVIAPPDIRSYAPAPLPGESAKRRRLRRKLHAAILDKGGY
ncbi:MAG: hypothetical protein IT562_06215 [Alphaproteobacteria bacterium]|nr:hypothetical protein [Alphaproteobacteria bacterium]